MLMRNLSEEPIQNRMVIKNEFEIGDKVQVRMCDEEELPGFVTAIMVFDKGLLMYEVSRGEMFYAFELERVI
jgi:hypothetical protein